MVDPKSFYKRFLKAKTDPLEHLIEIQAATDRPLYIVPQLMFFGKNPKRSIPTVADIFFGTEQRPGILRRLFTLFRKPDKVIVEISTPFNLQSYLDQPENAGQSLERRALGLRKTLLAKINRHRQTIIGPVLKTREELKESILTNDKLRKFMQAYAEQKGTPIYKVRKKADDYLEEVAAKYNIGAIKLFSIGLTWLFNHIYDGVSIDREGLNRLKIMSQKGPLILIPSHKSHIDYLILSYLLWHNNMPCPLIAAGKNLSFWPLGPIFRGGGAFFIRRTFKGQLLYSRVFSAYINKLLEEGFNLEFFIEGGRSRTGKMILPKLGLLSIIILWVTLKYEPFVFRVVKPRKTVKVAVYISLFFVIVATIAWSDAWANNPIYMPDSREVGDSIWKLGHPLTFMVIDLPIYLRIKYPSLQNLWSDSWALPLVLLLFLLQFSVYVQGVRMLINMKRIKNAVKMQ